MTDTISAFELMQMLADKTGDVSLEERESWGVLGD